MLVALPAEVLRDRRGRHEPTAEEALRRIAAIYAVEAELRGQYPDIRRAGRQARSKPLVDDLRPSLEHQLVRLSGRSGLAEAIRYMLKLWDGLVLLFDNGRLELNTNTVERAIRAIALGRKNALFAGSDRGGEHWATINDVNPHTYLADILERIVAGHPQTRIDDPMPWSYATPARV